MNTCCIYDMIYTVVMSIPTGRVATYGQVAELAGLPGHARQVGYALRVLPDESAIPWHRVVNAQGEISRRSGRDIESELDQRRLLESEGIRFVGLKKLSLKEYQWLP
jgi:methylated-DNA-protein-cysteine methyltransferase-like protein